MTKSEVIENLKLLSVLIVKYSQGDSQRDLLDTVEIALQCVREVESEEIFKD